MQSVRLLLSVCLLVMISGCQTLGILTSKATVLDSGNAQKPLIAAQLPEATPPQAVALESTKETVSTSLLNNTGILNSTGPINQPTEQQALQQALPDLQALLVEDPAAHADLLQEFGKTDPSMWAALTRRARSKLAYQKGDQLKTAQANSASSLASQVAEAQQKAGAQAIVQQLAARVSPTGQVAANGQASSNESLELLTTQLAVNQAAAMPQPSGSFNASNVQQVGHTTNSMQTTPVSNSNWIDNQQVANKTQPSQASPGAVTINPYTDNAQLTSPSIASAQTGLANGVRNASLAPSSSLGVALQPQIPRPQPPTVQPQVIENTAYERAKPTDWRGSLETTIQILRDNTPEQPLSTEEAYRHTRLRLLQLAAGKEGEAFDAIPGLSSTEQSYWSKQIYSMATLMDIDDQVDRKRRASAAAIHQAEALAQLRKMGTLQIRNLSFCSEIYGFGAYEPITTPKFTPGAEASLYTEIENYRSDSTEQGFHTLVATSYRVEDKHGALVDEGDFPVVEDYCLSRRRDFHITYGVTLPTAIYPGEYHLKLTITDQLGDKIGEDSVMFEIVAP